MKISQAICLVKELEEKISKITEEMELIVDLMEMPKYQNSKSLSERFILLEEKAKSLIEVRAFYKTQIDLYDNATNIKAYQKK